MKKRMSFSLVVLLMLSAATAYAVPSKTTADMVKVGQIVSSTGVAIAADFVMQVAEEPEQVAAEIAKIYQHVVKQGGVPVTYFREEVQQAVAAKLPEGFDLAALELNEFVPLTVLSYDASYGDIEVFFTFVTEYLPGQKLVALLGLFSSEVDEEGNDVVEWLVLDAEVQEDGRVKVIFPQDAFSLIENAVATALAILNEPAANVQQ